MNLEKAVLTRSREVRETFSMHYRRLSIHPQGKRVNAVTSLFFFAFFASSREQLPDLG
jgi:hypothetical protein